MNHESMHNSLGRVFQWSSVPTDKERADQLVSHLTSAGGKTPSEGDPKALVAAMEYLCINGASNVPSTWHFIVHKAVLQGLTLVCLSIVHPSLHHLHTIHSICDCNNAKLSHSCDVSLSFKLCSYASFIAVSFFRLPGPAFSTKTARCYCGLFLGGVVD